MPPFAGPRGPVSPSRRTAFQILRRVAQGEFADILLHAAAAELPKDDARLATGLVMGCLRYQPQLDFLIRQYSGRDPAKLDEPVRIALRLGIYQLRYLERIPAHAAVNESVQLTRFGKVGSAAGMVNAVLRKVNRSSIEWPSRAVEFCLPEWLFAKWEKDFGRSRTETIALALLSPPETYLRVPPGHEADATALEAEPTELPGCFVLHGDSPGAFRIPDVGSQAIVPMLDLRPGLSYLDVCAAPGNKTAQALEVIAPAQTVACDSSTARLAGLKSLRCPLVVVDATSPLPFSRTFDRILVDAPCSGTGTIRRNPEIKCRVLPSDLTTQRQRQIAILRNALAQLAPGGVLVYSTCSLEAEENEQVIDAVAALGRVAVKQVVRRYPGEHPGDGFFAAVLTSN